MRSAVFRAKPRVSLFAARCVSWKLSTSFADLREDVTTLGEKFDRWGKTRGALARLQANQEKIEQERELLLFQQEELAQANLSISEEQNLVDEKKRLDAAERLIQNCVLIQEALEGDNSAPTTLNALRRTVNDMHTIDKQFKERYELFDSTLIQLEELRRSISEYRSALFVDDARLEEINSRLSDIYQIKNKYGGSVEMVLEKQQTIKSARLDALPETES